LEESDSEKQNEDTRSPYLKKKASIVLTENETDRLSVPTSININEDNTERKSAYLDVVEQTN